MLIVGIAISWQALLMCTQVHITVPADLAGSTTFPCPLTLELWEHDTQLGESCLLLTPSSMPAVAAEIHSLPRSSESIGGTANFVAELAHWLRDNQPSTSASKGASTKGMGRIGPEAWETGVLLARQAVLWGVPATATLLVARLMVLPSLSPTPLACLARAHTKASASAARDPTAPLGGLLHLSLLSPCGATMLWTVLDWGKRWAAGHQEGCGPVTATSAACAGAGCMWDWEERNKVGDTPLHLLARQPKGAAVLQALREDPELGHAVGEAARRVFGGDGLLSQPGTCAALGPGGTAAWTWDARRAGRGFLQACAAAFLSGSGASEARYRDWVRAQTAPLTRACFLFNVLHMCTLLLRAVCQGQLRHDAPGLLAVLLPYVGGAVAISHAPHTSEVRAAAACGGVHGWTVGGQSPP